MRQLISFLTCFLLGEELETQLLPAFFLPEFPGTPWLPSIPSTKAFQASGLREGKTQRNSEAKGIKSRVLSLSSWGTKDLRTGEQMEVLLGPLWYSPTNQPLALMRFLGTNDDLSWKGRILSVGKTLADLRDRCVSFCGHFLPYPETVLPE